MVKNPCANAGDRRHGFNPCIRKMPWRRAWQPTPVFLSGESHGQRSLAGYSPQGRKDKQWGKTFLKNGVTLILMVVVFKDRNRNEPLFKISL